MEFLEADRLASLAGLTKHLAFRKPIEDRSMQRSRICSTHYCLI